MARWTFLRHGESVANAGGWLAGHRDVDLTERGVAQARAAADPLGDVPFTRVWCSDLLRARRTCALALPDATPEISAALRERTIGEWDGMDRAALHGVGAFEVLWSWDGRPPGGESHADLAERVLAALAAGDTGEDTLVVGHGGMMRAVLGLLDGRDRAVIGKIRYPNCAIQTREVPVGGWAALR